MSLDAGRVYDKMMRVDVKALQEMAALPAEERKALPVRGVAKAEAWRDYTAALGEKLREWGDNPLTWKALETDDLEKFRAELVLVVGLVKDELRSREENAVR